MIKKFKKLIWILTKKFKFLRRPYFIAIKIKNLFSNSGFWIPKNTSVFDFFEKISNVDYICFSEYIFDLDENEVIFNKDLDILVTDEQINSVIKLLSRTRPSIDSIRIDVYSLHGSNPFTFKGITLFPVKIGKKLIDTYSKYKTVKVVNRRLRWLVKLYRGIYIKQLDISLINLNENMLDFDKYNWDNLEGILFEKGWRPPLDSLEILSKNGSKELIDLVKRLYKPYLNNKKYVVFLIRDTNNILDVVEYINDYMKTKKISIIQEQFIDENRLSYVTESLRGGNWISKSFNVGGNPSYFFFLDFKFNDHSLDFIKSIKNEIREKFHKNIVHSSDSSTQALYYYHIITGKLFSEKNYLSISKNTQ